MGFKKKQKPVFVFVKNLGTYQWYTLNEKGEHNPIEEQEFRGYLQSIITKTSEKSESFKPVEKLHLFFLSSDDRCIYDIISGINTYFAKQVLYSLSLIPIRYLCKYELIIRVSGGELSNVWAEVAYQRPLENGNLQTIKVKLPQKKKLIKGKEKMVDDIPKTGEEWDYMKFIEQIKTHINQSIEMLPDDVDDEERLRQFLSEETITDPETGEVKLLSPQGQLKTTETQQPSQYPLEESKDGENSEKQSNKEFIRLPF